MERSFAIVKIPGRDKEQQGATDTALEVDTPLDLPPSNRFEGDPRITDTALGALNRSNGGDKLARYFGILPGKAEQAPSEASRSDELMNTLRFAPEERMPRLIDDIGDLINSSGADPEALRALMKKPAKPQ